MGKTGTVLLAGGWRWLSTRCVLLGVCVIVLRTGKVYDTKVLG